MTAFAGRSGVYHSQILPGFWLRVEWLWESPLPNVVRATWQILGLSALRQLLSELEQQEVG